MSVDIEGKLLMSVHDNGEVKDSGEWAKLSQVDHQALVGVIKSLMASELVVVEVRGRRICRSRCTLLTIGTCNRISTTSDMC